MIHLRGSGRQAKSAGRDGEFAAPCGGIKPPLRARRRAEAVTKVRLLASTILRPRKRGRL
jgi:hypothetical protein